MGIRNRVAEFVALQSSRGSLTVEAALGIASLMWVAVLLLQGIAFAVSYVQLQVIGYEATRILTASGDFAVRQNEAQQFLLQTDSELEFTIERDLDLVRLTLIKSSNPSLSFLPQGFRIEIEGRLLDAAVW